MSNCLQASERDRGLWDDLRRFPENAGNLDKCINNFVTSVRKAQLTVAEVAGVNAALQSLRLCELGEHL